jgi:hypothetical protein
MLRGSFSGAVTRSVPASCPFARKVAETSLRAIIRTGGDGNGRFSTYASSPRIARRYRLRCTARGNLYSRLGLSVDCHAGTGAGGEAARVLYRANATLALARHYLDYAQEPLGSYTIGPEGVPWQPVNGVWVQHPDGIAQWGLREYAYGHGGPLMRAARWLAKHERADGGIPYLFDVDGAGVPMVAPWISCIAQGQAISELMRAYQLTGSATYLHAARHALNPFLHTVPGGLTSWWDGVGGSHRWYEEYPAAQPPHVLNGFMFALVGLHDLAPRSLTAWRLWRAGVRGLIWHVQAFDVPAQRSQLYAARGPYARPVGAYYAMTDAVLLRQIVRWTHNRWLSIYAHRWTAYTHTNSKP